MIHSENSKDSCLPPPASFTRRESWNIKPVPHSRCPFLHWSINWYPSGQSSTLIAASFSPRPIFRKSNQISSTVRNIIQNISGLVSYRTSVKREQQYRLFALYIYSTEDQSNNWPWLGYYYYMWSPPANNHDECIDYLPIILINGGDAWGINYLAYVLSTCTSPRSSSLRSLTSMFPSISSCLSRSSMNSRPFISPRR